MAHFIGKYTHTFDAKGRVFVPKKYLHALIPGESRLAYVNMAKDPCVELFTQSHFEEIAKKLASLPQSDVASRNFSQQFFESTFDVEIDSAGRILIPEELRTHARMKLPGEALFAGAGASIMIWDPATHASHRAQTLPNYAADAEKTGV